MLEGKNVLVIGTGISGIAAVQLLKYMGATPILFDGNEALTKEAIMEKLPEGMEVSIFIGNLPQEVDSSIDLVVLSPGVPTDIPMLDGMKARQVPLWGEIELGYQVAKGRLAAITGTNGKTTTTTLVGEIMKAYYKDVYVVGNIGNPYTLEVMNMTQESVTVAELSSFQLETTHEFHPTVSAILNVTPDHLNRHYTMENYAGAKERIACKQTKDQVCVLNYENEYTLDFGKRCGCKVVYFSSKRELEEGYFLKDDCIYQAVGGQAKNLLNIHRDMNLVGICNVENVMAAIAISVAMEVPMDVILKVIKEFKAVEHRIEYVATKRGVMYYNDSKGTNPDAAIQGIKAMSRPTILIGGGYDKGSTYDEWIEAFDNKVKKLVLIGQTREKIADCARAHGFEDIILADTFEEALDICTKEAESGDAVLLSPACASWGMFPNYEVRGKMFKEYVNGLEEQ